MSIYIYPADCEDFSTGGLGQLYPTECTVTEEAAGRYEMSLEHPIADDLRWALIEYGNIVKAPVPVRESPAYEAMLPPARVETTLTRSVFRVATQRDNLRLRTGPGLNYSIITSYPKGTEVVAINPDPGSLTDNWRQVAIRNGGATGWMANWYLQATGEKITETLTEYKPGTSGVRPQQSREQLFRIMEVERDTEAGLVRATALHIFYDNRGNMLREAYEGNGVTGAEVVSHMAARLLNATPFTFTADDIQEKLGDFNYSYKSPVEILLDPDDGVAARTGAQVIRDNYATWLIQDRERDMHVTVRRGKNLTGVTVTVDSSDIVTRIVPVGKDNEGNDLLLTGTIYVDSPRIGNYPMPMAQRVDYDVRVVDRDPDYQTTFPNDDAARTKLRELAEANFTEDGVDLPTYGMEVDFVPLRYDDELEGYADLQSVFLYDTVTVIDSLIGLYAKLRVTGYTWNVLTEQYDKVVLGKLTDMKVPVYSYQLPTGGISGSKIAGGSADGAILRDLTLQYAKISTAAIQRLSADSIVALSAYIGALDAETIKTDALAANFAQIYKLIVDDVVADTIQAGHIIADTLMASLAQMVSLSAGLGEFDFATVQNLLSDAMILQQGYADSVMIANLAVTSANMLDATVGRLVLRGDDEAYYEINVGTDGTVSTRPVEISDAEIAAGQTADGRQIVQEAVNARDLNGQTVKASEAILNTILTSALTAGQITANEALIASASIPTLYTVSLKALGDSLDISANRSINFIVGQLDDMRIGTRNYIRQSKSLVYGDEYGLINGGPATPDAALTQDGALVITAQAFEIALPGHENTVAIVPVVEDGSVLLRAEDLSAAELEGVAALYGLAFEVNDSAELIATVPAPPATGSGTWTQTTQPVYDGTTDTVLALTDAVGHAWQMTALPYDATEPAFFSVWAKADTPMTALVTAAGENVLAAIGTEWVRVCAPVPSPAGTEISIAPLGGSLAGGEAGPEGTAASQSEIETQHRSGTLWLYKAMFEAAATRVSDWTCAPEDTEAVEADIRGLADSAGFAASTAQSAADAAMAVAQTAADTSANVRRWMSFTQDGLYQGKSGSTYNTLIDDTGFHILQLREKIGSFAKRRLAAEEVRIGRVSTPQPRCVLREAGDGGMIITVEGLT